MTDVTPPPPPPEAPAPEVSTEVVEPTDPPELNDKLVPVTEAIRYRKRAQAAEQKLEATHAQLQTLEAQMAESDQLIQSLERRQRIDALLTDSDAIDLETARLLTEKTVSEMDEPDVKLAIDDLRRHKPYLFRQSRPSLAMSATIDPVRLDADHAADEARTTGDRRDLLRYLRLRRKA